MNKQRYELRLHHNLHSSLGMALQGLHVQPKVFKCADAVIKRDYFCEEWFHVQAVFPEDADGGHHRILPQVQSQDFGCPAGDFVGNNCCSNAGIHAKGQYLAAGGDTL